MKFVHLALVAAVAGAALYLVTGQPDEPAETYQQYAERCLKPQPEHFKRDFTCIQDAQKFRPDVVTHTQG